MKPPDLSEMAQPGAEVAVRVTARAGRDRVHWRDGTLRVDVTAPPEDGKANRAVQKLLAKAMGVPRTALVLRRGAQSRDKVFRLEG